MKTLLVWCLALGASNLGAAADIEYWDTPRQGRNVSGTSVDLALLSSIKAKGVRLVRVNPAHWETRRPDFLVGDANDFHQLVPQDLAQLFLVLNFCYDEGLRVVLTAEKVPGTRRDSLTLWNPLSSTDQANDFWRQLTVALKGHPAIAAYDILSKPNPEAVPAAAFTLDSYNQQIVRAIRSVDKETPIIVESGQRASPDAFNQLSPLSDPRVLYSFHLTGSQQAGAVVEWQKRHHIPSSRIFVGEVTNPEPIKNQGWHWAVTDDSASILGKN